MRFTQIIPFPGERVGAPVQREVRPRRQAAQARRGAHHLHRRRGRRGGGGARQEERLNINTLRVPAVSDRLVLSQ